jgi:hypothetical protein
MTNISLTGFPITHGAIDKTMEAAKTAIAEVYDI